MGEYSKFNIVYHLQKWMDSVPGQTFLNYAYSWGASIVILGALFKLTHLPGANFMLFAGMGTEAFVFFLSAFDRPFDKTADGRDIPTHVTEEYLETGKVTYGETEEAAASAASGSATVAGSSSAASVSGTPVSGGQTIIIGGGSFSGGAGVSASSSSSVPGSVINDEKWEDVAGKLERQSKLTKQDIVDFANKYLRDDNFVCVYKRMGEDTTLKKIEKPAITPIPANRE